MSRILVTGSAGFIGTNLIARLLGDGHTVVGVDNYLSGQVQNTRRFLGHPGFTFIEQDVCLPVQYHKEVDWVLHLASPASPPHYQRYPIETLMVGGQGTQNALELAKANNAGFLLASTSEVYGDPQVHPQTETYWGHVNPNGLRSCYDEAKRYAEALTMAYHRKHGVNTRIVRIFNTYGPHMRADDGRVVSNLICQALQGKSLSVYGDGSQTRSFQYVSDLIEGILALMKVKHHDPVNIGNPDEYTIRDFAERIRRLLAPSISIIQLPLPADDPLQRRPDIQTARTLLGWEPRVSLEEGLKETIAYFKQVTQESRAK